MVAPNVLFASRIVIGLAAVTGGVAQFLVVRRIMIPRSFAILAIAFLLVGCNRWDSKPGHFVRGTNAMAGVSAFIATYSWNSSTNEEDLDRWEDLQPHYIQDVPWSKLRGQQFQAFTHDGILYVLSNPGWHHDYGGVAYNPTTNRFPEAMLNGFKPIGGHWYVWCSLEFNPQGLPKIYE